MRTAKLRLSAVALALITLPITPASAADSNSTSTAMETMRRAEMPGSDARSEVVFAGMVALLTVFLLLRRNAASS